jgi:hypothetical protein
MLSETVLPYSIFDFYDQVYLESYLLYICLIKNDLCTGALRLHSTKSLSASRIVSSHHYSFSENIHGNRIPLLLIPRNFAVFLKSLSFTATTLVQVNSKARCPERKIFLLVPDMCTQNSCYISVLFYSWMLIYLSLSSIPLLCESL